VHARSPIFENLEAGASLDDILEWFDGLKREQVNRPSVLYFPSTMFSGLNPQ